MKRTIPWVLALSVLSLGGCSSVPSFDERVRPLEPACSDEGSPGPCSDGQLCLSGRCFEPCTDDSECSSRETCEDGICVDSGRGIDAGMFDAGTPAMPCDGACGDDDVCDIRTDACVTCFDASQCTTDEAPICDYARGECVAITAGEACQVCNVTDDCATGFSCELRGDFTERVCLETCIAVDDCPSGYVCNTGDGVCEPPLGGCTQLRRSLDRITCMDDVDCVARNETAEDGTCSSTDPSSCRAACLEDIGCPGDWTCDGEYCQPMSIVAPAM